MRVFSPSRKKAYPAGSAAPARTTARVGVIFFFPVTREQGPDIVEERAPRPPAGVDVGTAAKDAASAGAHEITTTVVP